MSQRATSWVLGHSDTENALRLVLFCLAHNADVEGEGRMRPTRLAQQARIPPEQTGKALELLARNNAITYGEWKLRRDRPKGRTTFGYRVPVPDDYKPELREKPV